MIPEIMLSYKWRHKHFPLYLVKVDGKPKWYPLDTAGPLVHVGAEIGEYVMEYDFSLQYMSDAYRKKLLDRAEEYSFKS